MSLQGICSRREADEFIQNGWVIVDGHVINELGSKISPSLTITLSKQAQQHLAQQDTILLNKPLGIVSGQAEKNYRPATTLIIPENQLSSDKYHHPFTPKSLKGLAPAGRLDIDSQGLLILTQDGRLAKQLIGANSTIEKEYIVQAHGEITISQLKKLGFGLKLDGRQLKPAQVSKIDEHTLRFILKEGRKRQIRRMCQAVGLEVQKLKRIRIGHIKLGQLPVGQWRYLKKREFF